MPSNLAMTTPPECFDGIVTNREPAGLSSRFNDSGTHRFNVIFSTVEAWACNQLQRVSASWGTWRQDHPVSEGRGYV